MSPIKNVSAKNGAEKGARNAREAKSGHRGLRAQLAQKVNGAQPLRMVCSLAEKKQKKIT